MNCKTCEYYWLYEAITEKKPMGYTGPIPCLQCLRFSAVSDKYVPATKIIPNYDPVYQDRKCESNDTMED
jgi:hypothetical protein